MHGLTFGGHPTSCAIALKVIEIIEREGVIDKVRHNEPLMRAALDELREIPIVGDIRGAGHFWAIELVKVQTTKATFDGPEADWLLRECSPKSSWDAGLLCRLDDRGDPVLQLSPALVADMDLFHEIVDIARVALRNAAKLVAAGELANHVG